MQALIFADGKLGVGFGHISRSKALKAELEAQGFAVELLDSEFLLEPQNLESLKYPYEIIAIDSYILPLKSYQQTIKHAKVCLFFDDTLRLDYPQGVIINNALSVNRKAYCEKYPHHTLFLGSSYRLMQQEFLKILSQNKKSPPPLNAIPKKILITLGGKDILGLNAPLVQSLLETHRALEIHCITDSTLPRPIQTHFKLNAQEMVNLITSMDICICACGQTLGEILSCGIPAIALEVADNQNANLLSFQSCTLNIPKAYLQDTKHLCQSVGILLDSYSHSLRLKHQKDALKILDSQSLWQKSLQEILRFKAK